MSAATKFFIEKPQNRYWMTSMPESVIEAEELPKDASGHITVRVKAPSSIAKTWPTIPKNLLLECSGPARDLSFDAYVAIIHKLLPKRPKPEIG